MQCHASPIYTLARNPSFFKNFLTVGDWNARIWSEDCKESSIIWTKYCSVELTDGCWSPTKCSLFYLSRTDGNLEAWDLLQQQSEPVLTIKVRHRHKTLKFLLISCSKAEQTPEASEHDMNGGKLCRIISYLDFPPVLGAHNEEEKCFPFF